MTVKEIVEIIMKSENEQEGKKFGIRTDDLDLNVGEYFGLSHDWDFENDRPSDEYLNGTCTTGIRYMFADEEDITEAVEKALEKQNYCGKYQYLVAGTASEYGDDDLELIINNSNLFEEIGAIVVAKIK